ncbi:hypothetical protein BDP27DRAFT_1370985 [Rhodocollybia butyracea]|uniref:Uncharacterized protein n=1 Tax=Rhodocollybia butyracea TaxID=206335 RepID=A0A9P5PBY9_9AGAR|nr:hypothetical protein BDP27DRAFT_1370985 [Rhodocollybia butyracea]
MAHAALTPLPFDLSKNDEDWCHLDFQRILNGYNDPNRPLNLARASREHSLYGPTTTRMAWIYPPSHRFMLKPQALLMPEVTPETGDDADTSISSIEAQDGDKSIDSMGGIVVSQGRDVFLRRNRHEIDLLLTKVLPGSLHLCALLILGAESIRLESIDDGNGGIDYHCLDGIDEDGQLKRVGTDSKQVNKWLAVASNVQFKRLISWASMGDLEFLEEGDPSDEEDALQGGILPRGKGSGCRYGVQEGKRTEEGEVVLRGSLCNKSAKH